MAQPGPYRDIDVLCFVDSRGTGSYVGSYTIIQRRENGNDTHHHPDIHDPRGRVRPFRLSEAPSHGKPVLLYDIKSSGAKSYLALAKEIIGKGTGGYGKA